MMPNIVAICMVWGRVPTTWPTAQVAMPTPGQATARARATMGQVMTTTTTWPMPHHPNSLHKTPLPPHVSRPALPPPPPPPVDKMAAACPFAPLPRARWLSYNTWCHTLTSHLIIALSQSVRPSWEENSIHLNYCYPPSRWNWPGTTSGLPITQALRSLTQIVPVPVAVKGYSLSPDIICHIVSNYNSSNLIANLNCGCFLVLLLLRMFFYFSIENSEQALTFVCIFGIKMKVDFIKMWFNNFVSECKALIILNTKEGL